MRCRFLLDMPINRKTAPPEFLAVAFERHVGNQSLTMIPDGTEYEHPRAWWFVRQGCAEAVDVECHRQANRTAEELAAARHAYRRTLAGIHPDDFPLYDAGYIVGYDMQRNYLPGPNWEEYQAKLAAEQASTAAAW